MKKIIGLAAIMLAISTATFAQEKNEKNEKQEERNEMKSKLHVPNAVTEALSKKYPESKTQKITWEKEKGNYEANWGGKDGEANSVLYTPSGQFIEIVKAIPIKDLPKGVVAYAKEHYKTTKFGDVGRATDANGKTSYEVEIHSKDVIFDENGNFVKEEK